MNSKKRTAPQRAELVAVVLASADPRAEAMRQAEDCGLHFAAVWQWALEEAERQARVAIDDVVVRQAMTSYKTWNELASAARADRTLKGENRLAQVLSRMPIEADEIRAFYEMLRAGDSNEQHLETLLFREECPVDVLWSLLRENRCVTALAHRAGPPEFLEAVIPVYQAFEPVLTLIFYHYCEPDYPIEQLATFVTKHKERFGEFIAHNLKYHDLPQDRLKVISEILLPPER